MPYTVAQLEAFVSSAHYDAHTAAAIARGVPALPRLKGEQISPGVTRIHGNLCNVHGKYGPCDAALSGKKKPLKPRKGRKPAKTDAQRAAERAQRQDARTQETTRQQALNMTKVGEATGLDDHLANLNQFSQGKPLRPQDEETLVAQGLMERGADGSVRVSEQGRVLVNAAKRGDVQRARDAMSRGRDQVARQSDHAKRQQDAAGKRAANQIGRELTRRQRADAAAKKRAAAAAKKPSKASGKKPEKPPTEKPRKPVKRIARSQAPHAPALSNSPVKPKPAAPTPEKAPAKQIAPALTEAATALSQGDDVSDEQVMSLVRNGLVKLNKDGEPVLTAAGLRATMKAQSDQDKAMFASMGGGGGGGGGSGGGGKGGGGGKNTLWPKGPSGKRTPQAAAAQSGGGGKGDSKPKETDAARMDREQRDRASALRDKRDEAQRKLRTETDPKEKQRLFDRYRELDDAVRSNVRSGHISEADAQPIRDNSSTARIAAPKVRNTQADQQRSKLYREAQRYDAIRAAAPKSSAEYRNATDKLRAIGAKLNHIDDTTIKPAKGKDYSFRIFKDATGRDRWVAQSSTAFQDRDREIVSTKALADDVAFADATGSYGPLRWWHTPGLDLGDCDFNAMHGRVLIESGTFRSPAIAQKVAAAAPGLEISLGFVHLPSEPDADGVFHHIRRFERSLVPRGKASNRFTAFTVKETRMFDPTKVAALKTLGFSDDDITGLQAQAEATEKSAADQGVAFKADEPTELPDVIINGVTYKAFPAAAEAAPAASAEEDAMDGGADDAMEEPVDENALTLSQGDLAAIQGMIAQVMGALELEKKVAGHVQGLMAPYQATKDASDAEKAEQIAALQTAIKDTQAKLAELTGDQPAAPYRASQAKDNVLTDATMLAAAKQLADPNANDPWADIKMGLGLSRPQ